MPDITIYLGNKNYFSWSLRAWLALKQSGADRIMGNRFRRPQAAGMAPRPAKERKPRGEASRR